MTTDTIRTLLAHPSAAPDIAVAFWRNGEAGTRRRALLTAQTK